MGEEEEEHEEEDITATVCERTHGHLSQYMHRSLKVHTHVYTQVLGVILPMTVVFALSAIANIALIQMIWYDDYRHKWI